MKWFGLLLACGCLHAVPPPAVAQNTIQIVRQAVQTELAADAQDHSLWLYYETDDKPGAKTTRWVAQTHEGTLSLDLSLNNRRLSRQQQVRKMQSFADDPQAQAKQRKSDHADDQQATRMLRQLPDAFLWTVAGTQPGKTILHFAPNPGYHPPTLKARVFAAMEGQMTVDNAQHRIVSLKGRLVHDVSFFGGLGKLKAGGSFDVERRQGPGGVWHIVETHVHIQGHALIFKSISEQEDDVKSKFTELPSNTQFPKAEQLLLAANSD